MSIATLTLPNAGSAPAGPAEWISLAEASRRACAHPTTIQRAALAGRIRHRQGLTRTLYHRADVDALVVLPAAG